MMYDYWRQTKKETSAALLWLLENRGIAYFLDAVNLLYNHIDPDTLDDISEEIYGRIPHTAKELTDIYEPELRFV